LTLTGIKVVGCGVFVVVVIVIVIIVVVVEDFFIGGL
jgi:hypothetical protein